MDDVFQEFQGPVARPVLIVDLAIDVIRIGEINQFGAGFEITVIPAVQPQAGIDACGPFALVLQFEEHELARVQAKALFAQRVVDGAAEGHELRFDVRAPLVYAGRNLDLTTEAVLTSEYETHAKLVQPKQMAFWRADKAV